MKKIISLSLVLAAVLCSFAACGEKPAEDVDSTIGDVVEDIAEKVEETAEDVVEEITDKVEELEDAVDEVVFNVIKLGTSDLTISTEKKYEKGEITEEDTDINQVAYYKSEDTLVDFDVYQWAKANDETLADAAAEEAAEYEAEVKETEINGIAVASYNAIEENDGTEYATATYMIDDGDYFVEIVFWLDGENAEEEVAAIMATLAKEADADAAEAGVIELGTSGLTIAPAYAYAKGEISEEDTDENQVAYFKSEETLVDFDVYEWAKATDETLADAIAEEAAEYEATAEETEINGIAAAFYKATEENDGTEYETVTYMIDNGDYFVEIVFWLDGDDAETVVADIMATLAK